MDSEKRKLPRHIHAVAGASAGIMAAGLVQPLDVVKTRLQQQYASGAPRIGASLMARKIYGEEGIAALWRGLGASLLRVSCGSALYFITLNQLSALASSNNEAIGATTTMAIGGAARLIAATIVAPVTVVKSRLESSRGAIYTNTLDAISTIHRVEGTSVFFRGLGTTLLRDCPYSALYVFFYTRFNPIVGEKFNVLDRRGGTQFLANALAGGLSAAVATFLTHAPDTIKTRLQLQSSDPRFNTPKASFSATCRQVYSERGLIGFFAGVWPRVLKRFLSGAVTWSVYERIVTVLLPEQNEKVS